MIGYLLAGAGLLALLRAGASWAYAHPLVWPAGTWGMKAKQGTSAAYLRDLWTEGGEVIAAAGFPPSVAMAQAMVETGWGSSMRANPFGIRGKGDAGSVAITTRECLGAAGDGCEVQIGQTFGQWSSLANACAAYVAFCSGPMYRDGHKYRRTDPGRWLLWLWGMGYATAPNYPSTVVDTSRRVGLTLNDLRLVIPWDDGHRALAQQLKQYDAGADRRAATRTLLA